MTIGFVLINTSPTYEHKVYNNLSKISEIKELHPLFGEYDLIAKVEVKNYNDLGDIIIHNIKNIDGVIDTKILTGNKL